MLDGSLATHLGGMGGKSDNGHSAVPRPSVELAVCREADPAGLGPDSSREQECEALDDAHRRGSEASKVCGASTMSEHQWSITFLEGVQEQKTPRRKLMPHVYESIRVWAVGAAAIKPGDDNSRTFEI